MYSQIVYFYEMHCKSFNMHLNKSYESDVMFVLRYRKTYCDLYSNIFKVDFNDLLSYFIDCKIELFASLNFMQTKGPRALTAT